MFYLNQNNEIKSPQGHGLFLSQSTLMIIHSNIMLKMQENIASMPLTLLVGDFQPRM